MLPPPPPMHLEAKPTLNTVAVEMGSVDGHPSPSKHPWTALLALSLAMQDQPHAVTDGEFHLFVMSMMIDDD